MTHTHLFLVFMSRSLHNSQVVFFTFCVRSRVPVLTAVRKQTRVAAVRNQYYPIRYPILFYTLHGTSWRSGISSIVSNSCSNGCMATFYVVCWYSANVDATLMIELSTCLHGRTHNFAKLCLFLVAEMRSSSSSILFDGSAFLSRSLATRCDRIQPYTDH